MQRVIENDRTFWWGATTVGSELCACAQATPKRSTVDTGMNLFFYGTLMHPKVLSRVVGHEHSNVRPALLQDHVRLHVKGEDYPAVTSLQTARRVTKRELSDEESRVRGAVAHELSEEDIVLLDEFEGDEYERVTVKVKTIDDDSTVDAQVYVWKGNLDRLSPELWSFEDFMQDKAHRWVGAGADREDYLEVDRRRAMKGTITPRVATPPEPPSDEALPQFGRFLLKDFDMRPGWLNINNGSYGIAPRAVKERFWRIHDQADAASDLFFKKSYADELLSVRRQLAQFVNCDADDVVVVSNATTGVNAALRSLAATWKKGDRLLYLSTTIYNACEQTLKCVRDSLPHLDLHLLPVAVEYPLPHRDVVEAVRNAIETEKKQGHTVRLALIDAISSNPGVVVPWVDLVKLFKEHDVISLVDAAHEIGQLPIDLKSSDPDFWVSNCHKWLMCQRSCAAFYVAKRWQHVIHSIPTGYLYAERTYSPNGNSGWIQEFEWNGTVDWAPFLAVPTALEYRRKLGGEERINAYCHKLAIDGGELVARMLGTETMRNKDPADGELVANMVNVRLPIELPTVEGGTEIDTAKTAQVLSFLRDTQLHEFNTFAPCFVHVGRLWTRLSAHVFLELADFETIGQVLVKQCERIKQGEHRQAR